MPLSVGWIGGMRIKTRRRAFWEFRAVGRGGENFAESFQFPFLRRGEGAVGFSSSEIVDALLDDGALGMRHLVGFVGVESACGGFVRKILNGLPCVGDCGQGAAITGCRARERGLRLCQGCGSGWVYFFTACLQGGLLCEDVGFCSSGKGFLGGVEFLLLLQAQGGGWALSFSMVWLEAKAASKVGILLDVVESGIDGSDDGGGFV